MLVLDCEIIKGFLCLYGIVIILCFIMKKYKGNSTRSIKTTMIMFVIVLVLENIELCLSVTPDAMIKSGMEISDNIATVMNVMIYVSLCMVVIIRVMIINALDRVFYNLKRGKCIHYLLLLVLVLHDLFGVVDLNIYILGCMLILLIIRKFKPDL